jgi:hypothetical protein
MTGGGVLFSAVDGLLYALNPAASLSWLCIRDGVSKEESVSIIAEALNVGQQIAAEWLDASRAEFLTLGLLDSRTRTQVTAADDSSSEVRKAVGSSTARSGLQVDYRLLEQVFRIRAPADLQPGIDSLLGSLRIDRAADDLDAAVFDLDITGSDDLWHIAANEQLEVSCDSISLVAELERVLLQRVVRVTPHC